MGKCRRWQEREEECSRDHFDGGVVVKVDVEDVKNVGLEGYIYTTTSMIQKIAVC
jgi:hypothetical protein